MWITSVAFSQVFHVLKTSLQYKVLTIILTTDDLIGARGEFNFVVPH